MPKFRVISDAPAQRDFFSSHQPVADAIAALIDDETKRGKAVGLSGPWGSGKSTIIELLHNRLRLQPATRLFVWDAWAHQGDPLRRAFLESMAEFLANDRISWINRQEWNEQLDLLSGRKSKTETITEKRLTFWGVLLAILIVFCGPLGLTIASKYSTNSTPGEQDTRKFLHFGIALFLLPLAAAFLAWIFQRPNPRFWTSNFWSGVRGGGENSFLRLLVKEPKETVSTTSSKTLDPTSGEFRDTFVKMLDDALNPSCRRLVVVIDNLDRLEAQDALGVWSSMRIFFDLDSRQDVAWASRFWLVVPFDRNALKRLWKSGPSADPNDAAMLVDAFVNKTFQIVFDVAPPVVLRRIDYFGDLYNWAFPDAPMYGDTIYGLYDRLGPSSPSPREIKLFLNKLGALYLQGRSGIALPLLALYQLKERDISPGARELLQPDFLEARTLSLLGEEDWRLNWRKYLAAAHFNVPPDEALHVLNGDKVAQALESGRPKEVADLAADEGFWQICDRVIWERSLTWKQQAALLTNATRSLSAIIAAADPQSAARVWNALVGVAQEVANWAPIDDETAAGAELLLNRMRNRNTSYRTICERLVHAAANPPRIAITAEGTIQAAEKWHRGALTILRLIDSHETTEDLNAKLIGSLPANEWLPLQFALFRANAGAAFPKRFACSEEIAIPKATSTTLEAGGFSEDFLDFAVHLKTTLAELPWSELNAHLKMAFEAAPSAREIGSILRCCLRLNHDLPAFSAAGVAPEMLSGKLMTAYSANDYKTAGVCMVPLLDFVVRAPDGPNLLEPAVGGDPQVIREFADSLVELNRCELLFDLPIDGWIAKVQAEALSWIGDRQDGGSHFSPESFAAAFAKVRRMLIHAEDRLDNLVKSWVGRADTVPFLIHSANVTLRNAALYAHVLRAGDFPRKADLVAFVLNDLCQTPEDKWLALVVEPDFEDLVLQTTRIVGPGWIPLAIASALIQAQIAATPGDLPTTIPRTEPSYLSQTAWSGGLSSA